MTTLQEAAMRNALEALETCSYGDYSAKHVVDPSFDGDAVEAAIESLKAALAQQGEQAKPVAYITDTHQGPMVWTPEMYGEACTYCDDGEFPVPLYTRPMPAQDVTELVDALEKLARLGNGEHYGNSDGNMIARDALSKYKGAK